MRMRKLLCLFSALMIVLLASMLLGSNPARAQGPTYIVQAGDTLFSIADRFNVGVSDLATINGLYDVNAIYIGQILTLPAMLAGNNTYPTTQGNPNNGNYGNMPQPVYHAAYPLPVSHYPPGTVVTVVTTYTTYRVRPGDSLTVIAVRFGTTPQAILVANRINNPNLLFAGQILVIPRVESRSVSVPVYYRPIGNYYVVQPGDDMFSIASRFRRDVYAIARANGILDLNTIYIGQALIIP